MAGSGVEEPLMKGPSACGQPAEPDDAAVVDAAGSAEAEPTVTVPRSVPYIIGNEFCERFSYYGMRAILALYMHDRLKLSEKESSEVVHVFIFASYLFPFLGAFISDSYWGKYTTIFRLSLVYCLGNWVLAYSAMLPGDSLAAAKDLAWLGLLLITTGCGGIKPCVSAFGGEQIELTNPPGTARDHLVRSFFSYFYLSINLGSTLSMFIIPIVLAKLDFAPAFAMPAVLMLAALVIFWSASSMYVHLPPGGNVFVKAVGIMLSVPLGRKPWGDFAPPAQQHPSEEVAAVLAGGEEGDPLLIRKLHHRGSKRAILPEGYVPQPHWLDSAKRLYPPQAVEDVKQLLRILLLFLPTAFFWSLYDQQASRWTFQAERMDGSLPFGLAVLPAQMQTINAVLIVVMIPLFDRVLYPLAERMGVPVKPIGRMVLGMVLCSLSFVCCAALETMLDNCPIAPEMPNQMSNLVSSAAAAVGAQTAAAAPSPTLPCVHMLWQIPQYVIQTAGEVLLSITALELAFSQAPDSMKSLVTAFWLFTDSIGNLITVIFLALVGDYLTQPQEFLAFSAMCLAATVVLWHVGQGFTYLESCAEPESEA